jgi:hypothetical protein
MPFKGLWKSYIGKINSLNTSIIRGRLASGLHGAHIWQINSLKKWTYDGKPHLIFFIEDAKTLNASMENGWKCAQQQWSRRKDKKLHFFLTLT